MTFVAAQCSYATTTRQAVGPIWKIGRGLLSMARGETPVILFLRILYISYNLVIMATNISLVPAQSPVAGSPGRHVVIALIGVVWLIVIGGGIAIVFSKDFSPGVRGNTPQSRPAATADLPNKRGATLTMFFHPQCVCSRASMAELERLLPKVRREVEVVLVFVRPSSCKAGWERTDLWERATKVPGVTVLCDVDGVMAGRFGAMTSGHAVVYSEHGMLMYSGGITPGRGHEGDNAGAEAVLASLNGEDPAVSQAPVFGCEFCCEQES
ncbi:MAG: hypothetical protein IT462_12430 [Planctomycetes bacterium]|nr:hypothetical protein [Planctomycetota bacterium]